MSVLKYVTGNDSRLRTLSILVSSSWKGIDKQAATNADEIFRQLSIKQVQDLHRNYLENIDLAKKEIHQLVGSKYRDLIGIADDIYSMYTMANSLDTKVADLSYQKSSFVSFNAPDNVSTFYLNERIRGAAMARKETKDLILQNLITTTLILFNLLLDKSEAPLHILVFYAKFYYLIETIFKLLLANDKAVQSFYELKNNFRIYLELQLSGYFSGYSKNLERSLQLRSIFLPKSINNGNFDFDLLNNQYDDINDIEDQIDELDDEDEVDEEYHESELDFAENDQSGVSSIMDDIYLEQSRTSAYFKSISPIENYLIAYIILNGNNPELDSFQKILDTFILLRYNFLSSLFADATSIANETTHVNFSKIFQFIQDTFYFKEQFFGSRNANFRRTLLICTEPWNVSDVLGFRNWFEKDLITFNFKFPDSDSDSNSFTADLDQFGELVVQFTLDLIKENSSNNAIDNIALNLRGIMHCIKKLQITAEEEGEAEQSDASRVLNLLQSQKFAEKIISATVDIISTVYNDHFDSLVSIKEEINGKDKSIYNTIRVPSKSRNSIPTSFSSKLFALHDKNTEEYIQDIRNMSNPLANNSTTSLVRWFDEYTKNNLILQRLKRSYYNKEITQFVNDKLKELNGKLTENYWSRVRKFIDNLENDFKQQQDINAWYYILGVTIKLDSNIFGLGGDLTDNRYIECEVELKRILKLILKALLEQIPKNSDSLFQKAFATDAKSSEETDPVEESNNEIDSEDIPTRPSFALTSYFYKINTDILESSNSPEYGYGGIFHQKSIKDIFVELKTKWFLNELDKFDISTLQGLADSIYLLQFIQDLHKKAELKSKSTIPQKTVEIIEKNIEDYFNTNKYLYLPLLI